MAPRLWEHLVDEMGIEHTAAQYTISQENCRSGVACLLLKVCRRGAFYAVVGSLRSVYVIENAVLYMSELFWPITTVCLGLLRDENGRPTRRASQRKVRRADFRGHLLLLQLRVLRLGLLQDGNVGVGVFPEGKKVLICITSYGRISRQSPGPAQLQMG
jgi:hypothetical protein